MGIGQSGSRYTGFKSTCIGVFIFRFQLEKTGYRLAHRPADHQLDLMYGHVFCLAAVFFIVGSCDKHRRNRYVFVPGQVIGNDLPRLFC